MSDPDAVVVGAGPNGLAAAIAIAQAGRKVLVLESEPTIGGGVRSAELTLPGYVHDICSAIHPFAVASPFSARCPSTGTVSIGSTRRQRWHTPLMTAPPFS